MKDLPYYTTCDTPYKGVKSFESELESELNDFVGTIKEGEKKKSEINDRARESYRENEMKRGKEQSDKTAEFKNDLAIDNGIENHPKLDLLFSKAWEHGHSGGLSEVKYYFEDFIELI